MRLSRLKHRIRQNVMAPAIGLSVQYLSAVETGRKPVHDELLEASIKFFQQIDAGFDADALRAAADQSRRQVSVEALGVRAKPWSLVWPATWSISKMRISWLKCCASKTFLA